MAPFVVLRHDLPDGSWHYDWMIRRTDPDADPARPLLTFRLDVLPTAATAFDAQRIPDHRDAYHDFQGPVPGGRGLVTRVGAGTADVEALSDTLVRIRLAGRILEAASADGVRWSFSARDADP
jgi:hypothetical protein